jgi:hypothetical protein
MDEQAIQDRLEAIEAKLDRVVLFSAKLESLLSAYLAGGGKGILGALMKVNRR